MVINSQSLSKEQVLIVGCGDIGERLSRILSGDNYDVTGLRRHPPQNSAHLTYIGCNVTDSSALATVLAHGFDVVVISMTPSERSDAGYERAYVQTCRNLVEGLGDKKPRLVVFVSSTGVYGQEDGSWVDENSPTVPDSFSGKRLLEAEQVLHDSGLAHCIVRFSGIYGPGRNRLIDMVREKRAANSTAFTNRIHADDCAASIAHLIERHRHYTLATIYIASDSSPVPMVEILSWLATQMGLENDFADTADNANNKRCSNRLLLSTGFALTYPSYKEGYEAMLRNQASPLDMQ